MRRKIIKAPERVIESLEQRISRRIKEGKVSPADKELLENLLALKKKKESKKETEKDLIDLIEEELKKGESEK